MKIAKRYECFLYTLIPHITMEKNYVIYYMRKRKIFLGQCCLSALHTGGVYDSGSFCFLVDVSSRMLFSFM